MGGCQTKVVSICPLCSHTPIHLDTPICSKSFNRAFILLYHKCFPTLEAVMGVVRLRVCPYTPYVHMPPVCLDTPICLDAQYLWVPP